MKERTKLILIVAAFGVAYFLPVAHPRFQSALVEAFYMAKEYARQHVLFCLVPAFFIAGAIACFVSQAAVTKYFGARANKVLAYGVASVSGSILAVCSCTVLPLFAGIRTRGAGLGPAIAFLYSGPAINVLAIILTARVLGWELGVARAVGAIVFAIVIGLIMASLYRREEREAEIVSRSGRTAGRWAAARPDGSVLLDDGSDIGLRRLGQARRAHGVLGCRLQRQVASGDRAAGDPRPHAVALVHQGRAARVGRRLLGFRQADRSSPLCGRPRCRAA